MAALGILYVICKITGFQLMDFIPKQDYLYALTGYYCPGCGGTRAANALFHGHLLQSIKYHPVVIYTVVLFSVYIISHTIGLVTRDKVPSMKFRPIYFYVMIVIILVQWAVKNYIFFAWQIHVI
jgi:hypothetical protein